MGIKSAIYLDATNSSIKDFIDTLSNYISISDKKDFEKFVKYRSLYELKNIDQKKIMCNFVDNKENIDNWIKETEKLFEEFYHFFIQFTLCKTTNNCIMYTLDLVYDNNDLYIKVLYDTISNDSCIIHKKFNSFFGYLFEKGMIKILRKT